MSDPSFTILLNSMPMTPEMMAKSTPPVSAPVECPSSPVDHRLLSLASICSIENRSLQNKKRSLHSSESPETESKELEVVTRSLSKSLHDFMRDLPHRKVGAYRRGAISGGSLPRPLVQEPQKLRARILPCNHEFELDYLRREISESIDLTVRKWTSLELEPHLRTEAELWLNLFRSWVCPTCQSGISSFDFVEQEFQNLESKSKVQTESMIRTLITLFWDEVKRAHAIPAVRWKTSAQRSSNREEDETLLSSASESYFEGKCQLQSMCDYINTHNLRRGMGRREIEPEWRVDMFEIAENLAYWQQEALRSHVTYEEFFSRPPDALSREIMAMVLTFQCSIADSTLLWNRNAKDESTWRAVHFSLKLMPKIVSVICEFAQTKSWPSECAFNFPQMQDIIFDQKTFDWLRIACTGLEIESLHKILLEKYLTFWRSLAKLIAISIRSTANLVCRTVATEISSSEQVQQHEDEDRQVQLPWERIHRALESSQNHYPTWKRRRVVAEPPEALGFASAVVKNWNLQQI